MLADPPPHNRTPELIASRSLTIILGACRRLLLLMDAGCTATGLRFHDLFMKLIKTRSPEMKRKHDTMTRLDRTQSTIGERNLRGPGLAMTQEYIYGLQEIEQFEL